MRDFQRFVLFLLASALLMPASPLAARSESLAAFDERCIPACGVAPPSNTPGILSRRALPAGRLARLGATPDSHHGLLGAQVTTATLVGQLRDSSSAVIPGATVVATHEGTGVSREAVTDANGEFVLSALP